MTHKLSISAIAIYPVTHGFGHVLFESAGRPVVWGVRHVRTRPKQRNVLALKAIEKLLERYHPDVVVLEEWRNPKSSRRPRIRRLHHAIAHAAQVRGIEVQIYTRKDIQDTFGMVGAVTRYEIALAITRQFPGITYRLPQKRRKWESESPYASLFAAAALGITFYGQIGSDPDAIISPYYRSRKRPPRQY